MNTNIQKESGLSSELQIATQAVPQLPWSQIMRRRFKSI